MTGADLANLVNEAALFAVRRGENEVHANDFDDARDRVLMGLQARPSIVMNDEEKEHHRVPRGRPRGRARTCSSTPTRCTRSRSCRPAWRSA